jgi:hypothetical protein
MEHQGQHATATGFDAPLPTRVFEPPAGAGTALNSDPDLPSTYVEGEFLVSGVANV